MKATLWTKDFTLITLANLLMAIAFYFMVPILPVFLSDSFSATESQIGLPTLDRQEQMRRQSV